uniref:Focal_AT domain-containing protein n=1 Tax=Heterorhabditis bacteriophora TaxID=37862 RepID=A0A1I7X8L2_HETBA
MFEMMNAKAKENNTQNEAETTPDTEAVVTVRRMSLKEFTGLDPSSKEQIADLSTPSWKSTVSPSLISSYSARRRSVLSNDVLESPSKRLTTQMEESLDLPTAINRVSSLRQRLSQIERQEVISFDDSPVVRLKLLDESRRMSATAKELLSTLCCARAVLEGGDGQPIFIKSTINLQSAVNQLIHALSSIRSPYLRRSIFLFQEV